MVNDAFIEASDANVRAAWISGNMLDDAVWTDARAGYLDNISTAAKIMPSGVSFSEVTASDREFKYLSHNLDHSTVGSATQLVTIKKYFTGVRLTQVDTNDDYNIGLYDGTTSGAASLIWFDSGNNFSVNALSGYCSEAISPPVKLTNGSVLFVANNAGNASDNLAQQITFTFVDL